MSGFRVTKENMWKVFFRIGARSEINTNTSFQLMIVNSADGHLRVVHILHIRLTID